MRNHRKRRRDQEQVKRLFEMAAPGCAPWRSAERSCSTGKRRWPTEHAAAAALHGAQQTRMKRARGEYLGRLENRVYACGDCEGYHLTSMSAEDYESTRSRKHTK